MYPIYVPDRPQGTHELVSKLEFTINRILDNNSIELKEIKEFIEHLVYFVEHQKNNEIIKNSLKGE